MIFLSDDVIMMISRNREFQPKDSLTGYDYVAFAKRIVEENDKANNRRGQPLLRRVQPARDTED